MRSEQKRLSLMVINHIFDEHEKLINFVKKIANEPMEINYLSDKEFDRSKEAMALLVEIGEL